jgi:AbrB family looped-hinge helix DNA binding protein
MKTTIDGAGRVVVPKVLREILGLTAGSAVEMRLGDGCVEMAPAPLEVRMEKRGDLLVAVPTQPAPSLEATVADETADSLRTSRSTTNRRRR